MTQLATLIADGVYVGGGVLFVILLIIFFFLVLRR